MNMSKYLFTFSSVLVAMCTLPVLAKTDRQELTGELEIMSSILQTALKQDSAKGSLIVKGVGYAYLQHQGVVFTMDLNRYPSNQFFTFIDSHASVPVAPIAPNAFDLQAFDIEIDTETDDIEDAVEQAMEQAEYLSRESSSKLRSLSEKLREFSWEQRDYERRRRDLEFEKTNSDNERRAEIEAQLKELDAELNKLESKRTEVERYKKKTLNERKAQMQQRKEAAEQERKRFLASFEQNLGQVLCRYGAGLKALDDKEHVNFVLKDFETSNSHVHKSNQDRIYVFKHSDIQACVKDKIDQENLLKSAEVYGF